MKILMFFVFYTNRYFKIMDADRIFFLCQLSQQLRSVDAQREKYHAERDNFFAVLFILDLENN